MIADLHIHSKYSMATSKQLTPENLNIWGKRKGINLIGTGDVLHPLWLKELKSKLISTGNGLYRLKKEFISTDYVPINTVQPEFILTGEISSIYKDLGKTRKIHQVLIIPDLEIAGKLQNNLEKQGVNLRSDGRPICGLSAHDILEIALNTDERIFCIPAHIWTPWFSLFGAKSGYDSVEECYKDLSSHIRTLETGLSADVPMIRKVSALDNYALISSSDAHSPSKLGRNATMIDADMNYDSVIDALKNGRAITLDSHPQLGKYHYDGHRKCNVCWHPKETLKHDSICSVCGKPVTIGVLNRVFQLADRNEVPQTFKNSWKYIMTLPKIISTIKGKGENTKTVNSEYERIISEISEFDLLLNYDKPEVKSIAGNEIFNFLKKLNETELILKPGFDGEFGKIVSA